MVLLTLLGGCELAPRFVEDAAEVDLFLSRNAFASACVGLKMKDDDSLREYTAQQLAQHPHQKVATTCLCEALYDPANHTVDGAVAKGVEASHRDDLAECLKPALSDPQVDGKDRVRLVRALGGIDAPGAYAGLMELLETDGDPEVRTLAATALRPSRAAESSLLKAMAEDESPEVRAASARALAGNKADNVVDALSAAAVDDAEGTVRAAAIETLAESGVREADPLMCTAMLEDPDPAAREAAVTAFHGTKKSRRIKCLKKKLLSPEDAPSVRSAALAALGASPSKAAADVLCDSIGPFLRLHVKDEIAEKMPGVDIIDTQNKRDWERSLECVQRARAQGGYSCYARNHLGHWTNTLGGKASTPWCPGMVRR